MGARGIVVLGVARGRVLTCVRPLLRRVPCRRPGWESEDQVQFRATRLKRLSQSWFSRSRLSTVAPSLSFDPPTPRQPRGRDGAYTAATGARYTPPYGGTCPCCRGRFKAPAPSACPPGSPFGPNLRAFVLYLRFAQAIPFERLVRLLSDLFGLEISEGALANILHDSAPAFETQAGVIKRRLLSGTVLQSDETSARVGKRTFWTWVFHHADNACFVTAASRGKKVVEAFLGDHRPDVWVSDRLSAQMGWARVDHQVCLAHLIRDVQYAMDAGDAAVAPGVMGLLKRAVGIGRRRQTLADSTLVLYHSRLQKRLDTLLAITPTTAAGQKLQRIIKRFRQNLFVFVTNRAVPPTNNGSEQALRPCVVFRKVTNCFRSAWGAALYADVRSVFETARRRDIPILQAIRLTLEARLLPDGT